MTTKKSQVLFVCTENSARSQMAEGILRKQAGDIIDIYSAGTDPASDVHPLAKRVMTENGIDPSSHYPKDVERYSDKEFDVIVTTCDGARESCPFFPGNARRYHWGLDNPSAVEGDEAKRIAVFRKTFTALAERISELIRKGLSIMSDRFSIQEVIEIAIEIEKNGVAFYSALAKLADTDRLKELYIYLSQEEKRHITRFREILESAGGYQVSEAYYATEYMAYMKALADERVFKSDVSAAEVAEGVKSPREAIDIAIVFEKESVLFLHEMWKLVPESGREPIQKLLDEERDHLRRLSAIKAQIS